MFQLKPSWILSLAAPWLMLGAVNAQTAEAAPEVLLTAPGIVVTTQDVLAEMQRVPADKRQEALGKPETVGQIVQNLYLRRALTREADAVGLNKDPMLNTLLTLNRERLMTDAMLEHLDKKNSLKDADAEKLAASEYKANPKKYEAPEEVQVSHILIRSGVDKDGAKAKAEEILAQLKKGADFAVLAKERSEDPGSAAKGGDLGKFGRGRMVKPFEDAAFAMKKPGELSDIVESQFGYHILRLDRHIMPHVRPFSEIKDELVKELQQKAIVDGRKLEAERLNNVATIQGDALAHFTDSYKPAPASAEAAQTAPVDKK
ncbi:MAG: peptidylprolyl isomerase [Curvibacter lanceolatus]|jgi:peptidyl-prolyl cis-trans isomerase C|uniref:peptidylprolyl isomerase n=1 Tax=Curvibacter lanceolatus TaxID=86182 RepID=UPI00036E3E41|nr:peptidylprolyl isomerase [Curvibacter lanceolatus]MBV5292221.1 peptidylprolyl isomerase [Curvibacter lanceolatus]